MRKRRIANRGGLCAALLRGALAVVFVTTSGCSLVLDTHDLDEPDAMGPGLIGSDAAGDDDSGEDGGAPDDARADMEAGPADARADAAADADAAVEGGAREGGPQDSGSDAAADARQDSATDAGNADAPATDGAAPDASGGALDAGAADGCALTNHTNGVGGTWEDCSALNTRNRNEAQSACSALAASDCVAQSACNFSYVGVSLPGGDGGMTTYLWIYSTQNNARTNPGDVIVYPSGTAQCNNLPRRAAVWH